MGIVDGQLAIALPPESELDLGCLVLLGMAETMHKFRVLGGTDRPVVDLGDDVKITIEEQDACQPWRERLVSLQDCVCAVVEAHPELEPDEVCKALLEADGWSWTPVTFRTPLWMVDYDEVLRSVVVQEFEVLKWLARSSRVTE